MAVRLQLFCDVAKSSECCVDDDSMPTDWIEEPSGEAQCVSSYRWLFDAAIEEGWKHIGDKWVCSLCQEV